VRCSIAANAISTRRSRARRPSTSSTAHATTTQPSRIRSATNRLRSSSGRSTHLQDYEYTPAELAAAVLLDTAEFYTGLLRKPMPNHGGNVISLFDRPSTTA